MARKQEDLKEDSIQALKELKEQLGWKIIEKVLEANIKEIEEKLHGEKDLGIGEDIKSLQLQWQDRKRMKTLPEDLIEEYQDKPKFPVDLDPY